MTILVVSSLTLFINSLTEHRRKLSSNWTWTASKYLTIFHFSDDELLTATLFRSAQVLLGESCDTSSILRYRDHRKLPSGRRPICSNGERCFKTPQYSYMAWLSKSRTFSNTWRPLTASASSFFTLSTINMSVKMANFDDLLFIITIFSKNRKFKLIIISYWFGKFWEERERNRKILYRKSVMYLYFHRFFVFVYFRFRFFRL